LGVDFAGRGVNDLDYDGLRMAQTGFRADWTPLSGRIATLQGDLYTGTLGQRPTVSTYTPPFSHVSNVKSPLSGGNVLARWSSPLAGRSTVEIQAFYTRTNRDEVPVKENRDTFDVDAQQTLRHWARHNLVWGLGYRVTSGDIIAIFPTQFIPERRTDNLYSGFVQDEIALSPNRLHVTFGSKIEHNQPPVCSMLRCRSSVACSPTRISHQKNSSRMRPVIGFDWSSLPM
jgi:iron complex outermembrane receptor protein